MKKSPWHWLRWNEYRLQFKAMPHYRCFVCHEGLLQFCADNSAELKCVNPILLTVTLYKRIACHKQYANQ